MHYKEKKTEHWFLDLPKYKNELKSFISRKKWKSSTLNFLKPYIDNLKPRAITRDLPWGIPVPDETEGKVFYVWFDALIGYISAVAEYDQKSCADCMNKYWLDPQTKLVQFMGKDNVPFHSIIFPAMTMGQSKPYKLVDDLIASDFYYFNGSKFSKTDGVKLSISDLLNHVEVDILRYMIAATAPESGDSHVDLAEMQEKVNSELVGKFSNFAYRTMKMVSKFNKDEPINIVKFEHGECLLKEILLIVDNMVSSYESYSPRQVTKHFVNMLQLSNQYFHIHEPWILLKDPNKHDEGVAVCVYALEVLKIISIIMSPIIPNISRRLSNMLGIERAQTHKEIYSRHFTEQVMLNKFEMLLKRIDLENLTSAVES